MVTSIERSKTGGRRAHVPTSRKGSSVGSPKRDGHLRKASSTPLVTSPVDAGNSDRPRYPQKGDRKGKAKMREIDFSARMMNRITGEWDYIAADASDFDLTPYLAEIDYTKPATSEMASTSTASASSAALNGDDEDSSLAYTGSWDEFPMYGESAQREFEDEVMILPASLSLPRATSVEEFVLGANPSYEDWLSLKFFTVQSTKKTKGTGDRNWCESWIKGKYLTPKFIGTFSIDDVIQTIRRRRDTSVATRAVPYFDITGKSSCQCGKRTHRAGFYCQNYTTDALDYKPSISRQNRVVWKDEADMRKSLAVLPNIMPIDAEFDPAAPNRSQQYTVTLVDDRVANRLESKRVKELLVFRKTFQWACFGIVLALCLLAVGLTVAFLPRLHPHYGVDEVPRHWFDAADIAGTAVTSVGTFVLFLSLAALFITHLTVPFKHFTIYEVREIHNFVTQTKKDLRPEPYKVGKFAKRDGTYSVSISQTEHMVHWFSLTTRVIPAYQITVPTEGLAGAMSAKVVPTDVMLNPKETWIRVCRFLSTASYVNIGSEGLDMQMIPFVAHLRFARFLNQTAMVDPGKLGFQGAGLVR
jgi:hypothetical protein